MPAVIVPSGRANARVTVAVTPRPTVAEEEMISGRLVMSCAMREAAVSKETEHSNPA